MGALSARVAAHHEGGGRGGLLATAQKLHNWPEARSAGGQMRGPRPRLQAKLAFQVVLLGFRKKSFVNHCERVVNYESTHHDSKVYKQER